MNFSALKKDAKPNADIIYTQSYVLPRKDGNKLQVRVKVLSDRTIKVSFPESGMSWTIPRV